MSNVKDTVDAVKGIVEAVPIYEDMLQPATKELGKGVLTLAKTINIALAPVSALVWGYEKISKYLENSLSKKLSTVPEENIQTPDPSVAVPAVEALRYTAHNEELREMFSNLIATAMDKKTVPTAHPSFVEVIKQLNSDEAKILKYLNPLSSYPIINVKAFEKNSVKYMELLTGFSLLPYEAGCTYTDYGPSYLVNISRLGLATIDYSTYKPDTGAYDSLLNHTEIKEAEKYIENNDRRMEIDQGTFRLTDFGKLFYAACISNK